MLFCVWVFYSTIAGIILANIIKHTKWLKSGLLNKDLSFLKFEYVIIWSSIAIIIGFLLTKETSSLYNEHRIDDDGMIEINLPVNSRLTYVGETIFGTLFTRTSELGVSDEPKSYIYSNPDSNNIFIML